MRIWIAELKQDDVTTIRVFSTKRKAEAQVDRWRAETTEALDLEGPWQQLDTSDTESCYVHDDTPDTISVFASTLDEQIGIEGEG